MREVLISIQPKWCELIANGKKTVEVRKTRPKIDVPFKCYIYCTNSKDMLWILMKKERFSEKIASIFTAKDVGGATKANGKVIGEFVCDSIMPYCRYEIVSGVSEAGFEELTRATQLSRKELYEYCGEKDIYCWHISDLVIYEQPKELSEFINYDRCPYGGMVDCNKCGEHHCLKRPPQSWCYVKGGGEG